jgi:hypothetical protein
MASVALFYSIRSTIRNLGFFGYKPAKIIEVKITKSLIQENIESERFESF